MTTFLLFRQILNSETYHFDIMGNDSILGYVVINIASNDFTISSKCKIDESSAKNIFQIGLELAKEIQRVRNS